MGEAVTSFNVYSLTAVLMALPPFVNKYTNGTEAIVRSVKHMIIGVSKENHGVVDSNGIRELIFQCLFSGCCLNDSNFDKRKPPQMEMNPGKVSVWRPPRE